MPVGQILSEIYDACHKTRHFQRLGVGLVVQSELDHDPSILEEIVLKSRPSNVWLSYGDFTKYVDVLKDHSALGINLFLQVSSLQEVKNAYSLGARVIVLRGRGAGGYVDSDFLPPVYELITQARDFLQEQAAQQPDRAEDTFLVAGGGIRTGADVATCLELGADGICLGTLLAATEESDLSQEEKARLVAATHGRTVIRTNADGSSVYSGSGLDCITSVKSARAVIEDLMLEAAVAYTEDQHEGDRGLPLP